MNSESNLINAYSVAIIKACNSGNHLKITQDGCPASNVSLGATSYLLSECVLNLLRQKMFEVTAEEIFEQDVNSPKMLSEHSELFPFTVPLIKAVELFSAEFNKLQNIDSEVSSEDDFSADDRFNIYLDIGCELGRVMVKVSVQFLIYRLNDQSKADFCYGGYKTSIELDGFDIPDLTHIDEKITCCLGQIVLGLSSIIPRC